MNEIEYLSYGEIPRITSAKFFFNGLEEQGYNLIDVDLFDFINSYLKYHHSTKGNRSIWLSNDSKFCWCLTEFLKNFGDIENGGNLVIAYQNCFLNRTISKEMIFVNNLLVIKECFEMNDLKPKSKIIEDILHKNDLLLDISNQEILVSKAEFFNIFSKMPLFGYILSNNKDSKDECKVKQIKKGVIIQICIDKNEILRLKTIDNDDFAEVNIKKQNDDESVIIYFYFIFYYYLAKKEEYIIIQEWNKFSKILCDYLKKNKESYKEKNGILEKLSKNPLIDILVNLNSYDEKLDTFLMECLYAFIKHMNREIDNQINKNESPIQMNDILFLQLYSNFENIDFQSNDFSAFLCFSNNQVELDIKSSLNQNIKKSANDHFVNNFLFYLIILNEGE